MAYSAFSSQGTQLSVKYGSTTPAYGLINGIQGLSGSGGEKDSINTTSLSDTTAKSISGFPSPKTLQSDVLFDPTDAVHQALETAYKNGTKMTFKIILPTATPTTKYFDAYVLSFGYASLSLEQNAAAKCSMNLTIDGDFRDTE